jgi:hypothetical protein
MRSSFLSSLVLVLLLAGCTSLRPVGLKPCRGTSPSAACLISPYKGRFEKMLFKASIDIRNEHLTGLMLIKMMPDSSTRIVFTNEIGMTFFDFILKKGTFRTGYCFEPMNKKPLIGMFRTCFELMLEYELRDYEYLVYCEIATGNPVTQGHFGKYNTWAGRTGNDPQSSFVHGMSNFSDQTYITFSNFRSDIPLSVSMDNPFINLRIRLEMISF